MKAWITLLTQPEYLIGVQALHKSLQQSQSAWPLVVMVTDNIDEDDRARLQQAGCLLRAVEPLAPKTELEQHYASAQFSEVWTKLRAWQLTEFSRLVFLDADMLVLKNMDELFDQPLAPGEIAACHACRCNPNKVASYPASWQPENCFYTWQDRALPAPASLDNYLNGGFLVLTPDDAQFAALANSIAAIDDLSAYAFSEQDLLNEVFDGRWQPLSWVYNALKTLPYQHAASCKVDEIKNLHYIQAKPWHRDLNQPESERDKYYALDKLWWQTMAD